MIKVRFRVRIPSVGFLVFIGSAILFMPLFGAQQSSDGLEWPQFRGPNGSGVSQATGLPATFGPETSVIWKTTVPTGHSSPILTENHVFLTACEEENLLTICLDRRTGDVLWKRKAPRPRKEKIDSRNNPASPSPVTDGKRVYVFFPDFGMLAYSLKGDELWRFPLGPFNNVYGMGASPILVEDKVILPCDQNTDSFLIALEAMDGRLAWRAERPEAKSGHCTPVSYRPEGENPQVLVPGSFLLTAYAADSGRKLWWVGGLAAEMKSTPVISPAGLLYINGYTSPLNQPGNQKKIPDFKDALSQFDADGNRLLIKSELPEESPYDFFVFVDLEGNGSLDENEWSYFQAILASLNGMLAIRLGGEGDMTESNTVWQYRRSVPQLPSPLLYGNLLYMINDGGTVTTFKPENGEVIQQGRIRRAGSHFYASPVAADGKVFLISLRGIVSVLPADGSLEPLAQNDLGEQCYATPAIGAKRIYLRTVNTLYCFGTQE